MCSTVGKDEIDDYPENREEEDQKTPE